MAESRIRYSEIVLLHCVGVFMIVFGHICQMIGMNALGEFLITGVPLFLFVAGFLVGVKNRPFNGEWLKKKSLRILLPYYVVLCIVLFLYIIAKSGPFYPKQWIVLFANLQGLTNYVMLNDAIGYWSPMANGLGHFWFVTVIMLCYVLSLIVDAMYEKSSFIRRSSGLIMLVVIFVLQPVFLLVNVTLNYIVVFFLGYLFARKGIRVDTRLFIITSVVTALAISVRFFLRPFIDGSLFYDKYIAALSSDAVGLWIVMFVFYYRTKYPQIIDKLSSSKMMSWLDSIIYEVYLIHHIVIKGSWSVFNYIDNAVLASVFAITLTLVLSVVLHFLSIELLKFFDSKEKLTTKK